MFSADSVSNAFMDTVRKERRAFAAHAAGSDDYKTSEMCLRGKGLKCECHRCSRKWGAPGVDAQFFPEDSPFSRGAQDTPEYSRSLGAKPEPKPDVGGCVPDAEWNRALSLGGDCALQHDTSSANFREFADQRGSGNKSVMGLFGNPDAHVFTIKKVKFGNETDRLPALPGEYLS